MTFLSYFIILKIKSWRRFDDKMTCQDFDARKRAFWLF